MDRTADTAAAREALLRRRNRRVGLGVAFFAAGMVGVAFGSVPLYQLFCRVTPEETERFLRRRRARNWAVFLALLALVVLFYFITVARRSQAMPFPG